MGTEWPTPTECEHCRYVFDGSEVSGWRRMWEEVDMEDVIRGWKRKNREMREKGGEKKCDHCGKTFKGLKGLKTHQRNCFSWKPYK